MDRVYTPITYVSSGLAIIMGFMNENAAALGIIIALLTFLANIYFKQKQLEVLKQKRNTNIKDLE